MLSKVLVRARRLSNSVVAARLSVTAELGNEHVANVVASFHKPDSMLQQDIWFGSVPSIPPRPKRCERCSQTYCGGLQILGALPVSYDFGYAR